MSDNRWLATITEWCDQQLPPTVPRPIDQEIVSQAAPLLRDRVARLDEIAPMVEFLWGFEAPDYDTSLLSDQRAGDLEATQHTLDAALLALDAVPADGWTKDAIEQAIRGMEAPLGAKLRKFIPVLYVAIEGRAQGIPLFDSIELIGRERTLARLRSARARIEHHR
jgi:glutamyl-tRNA synthetase